jgi:ssRNA-specific RNase YbeY (16S rRNA maturation enzyme)
MQLYLLHGLLHLAGFDDTTPSERRRMERMQRDLMKKSGTARDNRA